MKKNWAATKKVNAQHGYAATVPVDRKRRKRERTTPKSRAKMGKLTPHPLAAK